MNHATKSDRPQTRGFSLVELMVAMAIGLVVTLVITNVLLRSENDKRTSTSLNDTVQSGAYTGYMLERAIRQAGTGYTQRLSQFFGCRLNAWNAREGGIMLPAPAAFPAPFGSAAQLRRLAPVLIEPGAADTATEVRGDVITVMSGAGGKSEMPMRASAFTAALPMNFSLSFTGEYRVGDLVLLGGDRGANRDCMIQQVTRINGSILELGDNHTSGTGTTINFADFAAPGTSTVYAAQMGYIVPTAGPAPAPRPNPPLFQMFAVGDNAVLFSYDLLRTGTTAAQNDPQPVADNVIELRALYGIDTDLNHSLEDWQDPATSPYRYAELTDGSTDALRRLKQITAIRIGIITRSPLQEKLRDDGTPVSPEQIVLFQGLTTSGGVSLQRTRTLTADERNFRYRTYEAVIPLRNMQFAPLP